MSSTERPWDDTFAKRPIDETAPTQRAAGKPMSEMRTDIEIARAAALQPIAVVAAKLGIPAEALCHYGPDKAKIRLDFLESLAEQPDAKLVLVTAMTPTPAGEGKTTTTVGLGDALNRIGRRAAICLREPSLGPCFGMKGGAAGGGYAQVVPMEDINLHFTGDFHAIGTAHNLLAALLDNHLYWGNELEIDSRRITWRRVMDMNDRALRSIVSSLGGIANGFPREDGFDITVASEVMAIFCLANDLVDLERRLGNIVVGYRRDHRPVDAAALSAPGPMSVLLKDAIMPNLVQTLEGNPAFIHGGPFANIAHGCNSAIATRTALKLADYVVTEAGFGADLGAEKFFDIKCRKAGLTPDAAVIVATVRALKMHGGVGRDQLGKEDLTALRRGMANLTRHVENVRRFGVPAVVALNRFTSDTEAEHGLVRDLCRELGVEAVVCSHWAEGSAGAEQLAEHVAHLCEAERYLDGRGFRPLYPDDMPLWDKLKTIATQIYGAEDIIADKRVRAQFTDLQDQGFGHYPVCVAKTQYSFSTDPNLKGAPSHHVVPIREVRLASGAEFVVVICGDIMTMPGLPRVPAANQIRIDQGGLVEGLF
jgi:formate--tetrahydrofolate ligase